ncbi:PREDICTED: uncharacterized protein LOC105149878 isoform X2 [Acromyrmex echinatior]|uniref:uncharacterized protein LOC105149878 isoform X2 n=1 Tax=Acromyrmex echinatior TaxID=103372 RepID=UPI000580BD42|nr:PREDICTED: uncharacterized protein LOC105149878 isoform X2 [Acromyrmex echinatior]
MLWIGKRSSFGHLSWNNKGTGSCIRNRNDGTNLLLEMSSLAFRSVRNFSTVLEPPESWPKWYRNDSESMECHIDCTLCRSGYC